ncbi:MAG TPA: hypothetical protein VGO93_17785 [Candidatus Xenobia bacterium]|jgi:hypothetical protein
MARIVIFHRLREMENLEELHLISQQRVARHNPWPPAFAVGQVGGDDECPLPPHRHAFDTPSQSGDLLSPVKLDLAFTPQGGNFVASVQEGS